MNKIKIIKIIVWVIAVLVVCVFALGMYALFGSVTSHNIERYINLTEENNFLPKLDELGEYEDYYFKYYHKNNLFIFSSDAYTLKVSYDAENYEKEKERLEQKYVYRTEPWRNWGGEKAKEAQFQIDTFDMKILSELEYDQLHYPKRLAFVGTSDKNQEIAYVYYYDSELDYIDRSFAEFLREDCGW